MILLTNRWVLFTTIAAVIGIGISTGVAISNSRSDLSRPPLHHEIKSSLDIADATEPANPGRFGTKEFVRNHLTDHDKRAIVRLPKVREMPRTNAADVRSIANSNDKLSEALRLHSQSEMFFTSAAGFGIVRMRAFVDEYGNETTHPNVERIELVSVESSSDPTAYVTDSMATPRIIKKAKRRSLDGFERAALEALRSGENLVYSPVDQTRMMGALRADASCVACHTNAKDGDLLGAFTYWLDVPVDQVGKKEQKQPSR